MFLHKNKFSLALAVLAVLTLAFVSLGGEFLHSQIHHHKDQAAHDECFISILQTQVLILLVGMLLALISQIQRYFRREQVLLFSHHSFDIPPLRAPPVSHL